MKFLKSIELGIEAASNFDRNKAEINNIFECANDAVFSKTMKKDALFSVGEKSISSGYFERVDFGDQAYPVSLRCRGNVYNCYDDVALIDTLKEVLSSAHFGFYVKELLRSTDDM